MWLFQDFLDQSKQLNQTPSRSLPAYHPPNKKYKIIHQAVTIPNLPAPLHYLNFLSMIGQPNTPMLRNNSAIRTTALDTATVLASSSPHMAGQLSRYSISAECAFEKQQFKFANKEHVIGAFPKFQIQRKDSELSFEIEVITTPLISHFTKLRFGLAEHWSVMCQCQGEVKYKGQHYDIDQLGAFEYGRSVDFSYVPLAFFTYQIINLADQRQLLLEQIRDSFNRVVQSRIYLRDLKKQQTSMFDQMVRFQVHRVYPAVKTPNGQKMYLPREFEWCYQGEQGYRIHICAQSRGDFKFGLAAGYVGSFKYQVKIDNYEENGESGYCEYVDCRALKWQEHNSQEKIRNEIGEIVPFSLKK
ncbi:DUF6670 family protein [Acinetobacter sp. BSP-153]|uniref:DUF6670 family protein n=1 Tax=unclassified Acinetobacter TaxID=196816 RepID=UPI000E5AB9D9|nr:MULTISPECIES: DUF6670 family protein [unclassified Acinetobacter]RGD88509.1 hypothetical protein DYI96_16380 [Acinetobacter sp. SWAC57]